MPKSTVVKEGGAYLPKVDLEVLEEMQRREPFGKAKYILQAAVLRKRGKTLEDIENCIGIPEGTVHGWLARLALGGLECRHDKKSPGRPPRLNQKQQDAIEADIDKSPQKSGFERGNWTARLVARRILNRFNVPYTNDGALKLAHRLGFSVRKPRPIPYNSATPEEQREFIKNAKATIARWGEEGRHVVVIDAATIQDSPSSKRGLRRRGGRDTVGVNYSRKSTNILGALGNGALHIEYHDNLKADSYISLIENVVKKYGKVGIVADNAKAIVGKDVTHYINSTDGAVEMIHFLPHTPQPNPIEIEWREIKRAVADIFFGGLDELQEAITRMLANEEIAIVKLYDWLIPP